jgi:hypothetical protein
MPKPSQLLIQSKVMDIKSQVLLLRARAEDDPIAAAELGSKPVGIAVKGGEITEVEFHEMRATYLEGLLERDEASLLDEGRVLLLAYASSLDLRDRVRLSLLGYALTGRGDLEAVLTLLEG